MISAGGLFEAKKFEAAAATAAIEATPSMILLLLRLLTAPPPTCWPRAGYAGGPRVHVL